jgi:hypothetical protein
MQEPGVSKLVSVRMSGEENQPKSREPVEQVDEEVPVGA